MSTAPFYSIDMFGWPLVVVRFPHIPVHESEIDAFQVRFTAVLQLARKGSERVQPTKLHIAMDLNGIVGASFQLQCRAAKLIQDIKPYVVDVIAATALTASNALVRAIFTAITTIQPLSSEHSIFESEADAVEWLRGKMALTPVTTGTL